MPFYSSVFNGGYKLTFFYSKVTNRLNSILIKHIESHAVLRENGCKRRGFHLQVVL